MEKDDLVYAGHMLDTAARAAAKVRGLTRAEFDADEDLRLAVTHLIQTLGEAAARVSAPFRTGHPLVPWAEIVAMRHRIVHDYMNVDEDVVWQTATEDLPPLVATLAALLGEDESPPPVRNPPD